MVGLNMPKGLQGFQKGHKSYLTEESKKKISLSKVGQVFSEEHKTNLSKALKGRKTPWIWKMHEKTRGRKQSQEEINNRKKALPRGEDHWLFGKTHSDEAKKKIGNRFRGKHISEEHKAKISKYLKEHPEHPGLSYWKERKGTEQFDKMISQRLKGNKRCNTSIELKLQNFLKEQGIEFETHYPILGHPDIFIKPNIAIFADGCFWHKCPECGYEGQEKRDRDKEVTSKLTEQGYTVIRLWEHDIKNNKVELLNKLIAN